MAADVAEAVEQIGNTYSRQLESFLDGLPVQAAVFGIKTVAAIVLFLIGRKLIRMLVRITVRSMERAGAEITVRKFIKYLAIFCCFC